MPELLRTNACSCIFSRIISETTHYYDLNGRSLTNSVVTYQSYFSVQSIMLKVLYIYFVINFSQHSVYTYSLKRELKSEHRSQWYFHLSHAIRFIRTSSSVLEKKLLIHHSILNIQTTLHAPSIIHFDACGSIGGLLQQNDLWGSQWISMLLFQRSLEVYESWSNDIVLKIYRKTFSNTKHNCRIKYFIQRKLSYSWERIIRNFKLSFFSTIFIIALGRFESSLTSNATVLSERR